LDAFPEKGVTVTNYILPKMEGGPRPLLAYKTDYMDQQNMRKENYE
jgi:hypothetical protein